MQKFLNVGGYQVPDRGSVWDSKRLAEEIDGKLAAIDSVLATAKRENRDLSREESAKIDGFNAELAALAEQRDNANQRRGLAEALANGSVKMPAALKDAGASGSVPGIRSRSGKPLAMASGPKQKLSRSPVHGHLYGELCRAAAIGVTAFTPDEVRMQLKSDDNSKGGYAVPDSWLLDWVDRAVEMAAIAPFCTRVLMDSESLNITTIQSRPTIETKAQLDKFASTGMVFGSSRLEAFTAGGVMLAALELLEDSPNAGQQIEIVTLRGVADWLNDKILNGSGSQEPLGIINREDIPSSGTTGDITWDAIADGVTALRNAVYVPNLCVVSPNVWNALHLQRENSDGDGLYLARPEHLRDLNIIASTHCPDDKVVMGDFAQWFIGVRQGARVDVSPVAGEAFERNGMLIRPKTRMDWTPTHTDAFYILDGVTLPE